jgi:hypothetical protein
MKSGGDGRWAIFSIRNPSQGDPKLPIELHLKQRTVDLVAEAVVKADAEIHSPRVVPDHA